MSKFDPPISACRHCQSYQVEGRRGGQCQQLGVPVKGSWKSCALAISPFAPAWETTKEPAQWQTGIKVLPVAEITASVEEKKTPATHLINVPKVLAELDYESERAHAMAVLAECGHPF